MNYRCKCGEMHEFKMFETFPTTWGGTTSFYEYCCLKIDKHLVLITNTYPPAIYLSLYPCAKRKRYIRVDTLLEWSEFANCEWAHGGQITEMS